jgi:NADH-quinone oxidoreductase subunit L
MEFLLPLVILLPFVGSALIGLFGISSSGFRKQEGLIGSLATLAVATPFFILLTVFLNWSGEPVRFTLFSWMRAGGLDLAFSYSIDQLSLLMGLVVTGVGALIHVYSIGYMHGDSGFYRFFMYLNLFIFAMTNLILGDNMIVTFLGWEGVGACSYFLIGFWYTDMSKAAAAQKAFVANRIGDFAFLVAVFLIYSNIGSLNYSVILANIDKIPVETGWWVCFLLFAAATGKSAQIPLFVWLPDAMAGPTPVSALIHAATMVTSGIYLIARTSPLFITQPQVLAIVCAVGAATAIMAALIAIAQNDIKKVLAYSTVSQLGFMFMALGAGAFSTAIFHVFTHAFFKACLFLGSGSVIHAMEHMHTVEDPQDIRTMGGLRKYMPSTSTTFWISTLAIAGVPLLSGFFSKDEILSKVFQIGYEYSPGYQYIWIVGIITAFLTAFYMTRVTYLTFNGHERYPHTAHPHESSALMTIPLWVLAFMAIVAGYLGLPELLQHGELNWISHTWLASHHGHAPITNYPVGHLDFNIELMLMAASIVIALLGVGISYRLYSKYEVEGDAKVKRLLGPIYRVLENKFYLDEIYNALLIRPFVWISQNIVFAFDKNFVDGLVNGAASLTRFLGGIMRQLQSGLVSSYALIMLLGIVGILFYLIY